MKKIIVFFNIVLYVLTSKNGCLGNILMSKPGKIIWPSIIFPILFPSRECRSRPLRGGNILKKVVVAIDGSEVSRGVIDYALHYAAREKDAELLFIHVVDGSEYKRVSFGNFSVSVPPTDDGVMYGEKYNKKYVV